MLEFPYQKLVLVEGGTFRSTNQLRQSLYKSAWVLNMRDVEIDQSGRTDVLTVDTALALSNSLKASILIPKAVKQECYHALKASGIRKSRIGVRMLTAALVVLLRPHIGEIHTIIIDLEYVGGATGEIKGELLHNLRQNAPDLRNDQIVFGQIGKKSGAHTLALQTYRGVRQPDRRVTASEMLDVLGLGSAGRK